MGVLPLSLHGRQDSLCGHSRDEIQERHSLSVSLHPHHFEWRLPSSCTVLFDTSMRAGKIDNAWFENVAADWAATMVWLSIQALVSTSTCAMWIGRATFRVSLLVPYLLCCGEVLAEDLKGLQQWRAIYSCHGRPASLWYLENCVGNRSFTRDF